MKFHKIITCYKLNIERRCKKAKKLFGKIHPFLFPQFRFSGLLGRFFRASNHTPNSRSQFPWEKRGPKLGEISWRKFRGLDSFFGVQLLPKLIFLSSKIRNYDERGFSLRRPCILLFITQSIPGIFHLKWARVLFATPSFPLASCRDANCWQCPPLPLARSLEQYIKKLGEEVTVFWNKCAFIAEKADRKG